MSKDLAVEALIQEYISLRSEISQRIQHQLYIIGANITFFAAILTFLNPILTFERLTILLAMPMISFVIAWLYFEQDVFLTQAASYLHQGLRPAILARLPGKIEDNADVLNWEGFRRNVLFDKPQNRRFLRYMVWFRLLATLGPGIAIMAVAGFIATNPISRLHDLSAVQWAIFAVDSGGLVFATYSYGRVIKMYQQISASDQGASQS